MRNSFIVLLCQYWNSHCFLIPQGVTLSHHRQESRVKKNYTGEENNFFEKGLSFKGLNCE